MEQTPVIHLKYIFGTHLKQLKLTDLLPLVHDSEIVN